MQERHGDSFDIRRTLRQIQKILDNGDIGLDKFLEKDRERTTAPSELTNPPGYYLQLAKDLVRETGAAKVEAVLETQLRAQQALGAIKDDWVRPTCCKDGTLPAGGFCSCETGKFAAKLAALQEGKKSA